MVTPRELQWVKSNWASRPGGCSWGKYTSRSGPCSTGGVEYGGPDSSAGPPLWARTGPFPGFYGDVAPHFTVSTRKWPRMGILGDCGKRERGGLAQDLGRHLK